MTGLFDYGASPRHVRVVARSAYKARERERERESSAALAAAQRTFFVTYRLWRGNFTCVARCLYLKFPHGNLNSQVPFARNLSTIQYNMYIPMSAPEFFQIFWSPPKKL